MQPALQPPQIFTYGSGTHQAVIDIPVNRRALRQIGQPEDKCLLIIRNSRIHGQLQALGGLPQVNRLQILYRRGFCFGLGTGQQTIH